MLAFFLPKAGAHNYRRALGGAHTSRHVRRCGCSVLMMPINPFPCIIRIITVISLRRYITSYIKLYSFSALTQQSIQPVKNLVYYYTAGLTRSDLRKPGRLNKNPNSSSSSSSSSLKLGLLETSSTEQQSTQKKIIQF